ncbi:MAG: hypothetical protein ACOCW8_01340 [bacterium]
MLKTYKAQIKKDSIQWVDDKPEELNKEDTLFAYVTIIQSDKKNNQSPKSLVDFFRNSPLFDSGIDLGRDKDTGREVIL